MAPKKLGEIMNQDLAGFQLVIGYFLEIDHGLMGFHPALIAATRQIVVCLDRNTLKKVWELLPRTKAKVTEFLLVANIKEGFGFDLQNEEKTNTTYLRIFSEEAINTLIAGQEKPFAWTPGVISTRDYSNVPCPV